MENTIKLLINAKNIGLKLIVKSGVIWCTNWQNITTHKEIETVPYCQLPKSLHKKWEGKILFSNNK